MVVSFSHRKDLSGNRRNKQRSIQLSFIVFQTCSDRDNHRSVIYKRTRVMGHIVEGIVVCIGQIGMTQLEMVGS